MRSSRAARRPRAAPQPSSTDSVFCFDTDVLSALIRRAVPSSLVRRISEVGEAAISTTAISIGEIVYGLARRGDPTLIERVERVLASGIRAHPFDGAAARVYGELRAQLEAAGTPLADPDLQIAGIALARDLVVVTHNVGHFDRVSNLRIEDWL